MVVILAVALCGTVVVLAATFVALHGQRRLVAKVCRMERDADDVPALIICPAAPPEKVLAGWHRWG